MELPLGWGTQIYTNGSAHMTKMVAIPVYGRTFNNLLKKYSAMILKLELEHYALKLYKVYINDDTELTYFTTMSNLVKLVFCAYIRARYQVSVYMIIGPLVLLGL